MKSFFQNLAKRFDSVSWGGIIIENGSLSQGRIMGWILFGLMINLWAKSVPVPESLMFSWLITLGYATGTKFVDPLKTYLEAKRGPGDVPRVTEIDALGDDEDHIVTVDRSDSHDGRSKRRKF